MAKPKPNLTADDPEAMLTHGFDTLDPVPDSGTPLNVNAVVDIAEQVAALHTTPADVIQDAYAVALAKQIDEQVKAEELAVQRALEKAHLDAQDPIVYAYNNNAQPGESLIGVPLADIRQSVWTQLEPWMQASVKASHLYTKVEG